MYLNEEPITITQTEIANMFTFVDEGSQAECNNETVDLYSNY